MGSMTVAVCIFLGLVSDAGLALSNKLILSEIPHPVFLTTVQLLVVAAGTRTARHATGLFPSGSSTNMSWVGYLLRVAPASVLLFASCVTLNAAYAVLPLALVRLVLATQLFWYSFGMVLWGYERRPSVAAQHTSLAFLSFAVLWFGLPRDNAGPRAGTLIPALAAAFDAGLTMLSASALTGKVIGRLALTRVDVACHAAPGAFALALVSWVAAESWRMDWGRVGEFGLMPLIGNGLCALVSMTVRTLSASAMSRPGLSLARAAADAVSILIGIGLLGEEAVLTLVTGMSAVTGWAGTYVYKMRAAATTQRLPILPLPLRDGKDGLKRCIAEDRLAQLAQTGDIVVFTTAPNLSWKALASSLVRLGTLSSIDHVALVVRPSEGGLYLAEALSDGVIVSEWHHFRDQEWHLDYSRVALRRLLQRDGARESGADVARQNALEHFSDVVKGNHYGMSVCGMLCGRDKVEWKSPDRTYFCSELVAEAYKQAGLLESSACAPKYVPGDFGQGRRLPLLGGATLSEEVDISFPNGWDRWLDAARNFTLGEF